MNGGEIPQGPDQGNVAEPSIPFKKVLESQCATAIIELDKAKQKSTLLAVALKIGVGTADILESMRVDKRIVASFEQDGKTMLQTYERRRPLFIQLHGKDIKLTELAKKMKMGTKDATNYFARHPDIPEAFNFMILKT